MFGHEARTDAEVDLSGIFIGLVVDNADPKALERVKIRVLGVHDMENENQDNAIWCSHVAPSRDSSGELPEKDDFVYVQFVQKDPMHPVWIGWVRVIK